MPLPVNSRLGPYEIKSPLGAGGMGEVYRARDSRLNRDVAVKVLRTDGVGSPDLRSRFEREARAVAALNHPNIVAVYDFGIEQDQQYIVSELIDGESLRSLLRGKAVPARKLVDIATQVADGLAAAHTAGIVHRDLKPENIMIAKDGRLKILDFGLARQAHSSSVVPAGDQNETLAALPEVDRNMTGEGVLMGTPNYMSPEQALGREVDYHSDQFSFGLILYELASGKQAFAKTSTIETMAAIVREEPAPMDEKLPPPLRWIIDRCLAKEPEQRYESTRDLYRDLKNLRDHFSEAYSSGAFVPVTGAQHRTGYGRIASICCACMALTTLLVYFLKPTASDIGELRYSPFASNAGGGYWSPDGKAVAYRSTVDGTDQTFLKILSSPVHLQMTHSKLDVRPIGWSADGSHIILADTHKIYSLATVGGEPDLIMDADDHVRALSNDGKALAVSRRVGPNKEFGIAISDPIGSPFVPYTPAPFATKQLYAGLGLRFSPDGKNLLLLQDGADNKQAAWLIPYPAGSGQPRQILPILASLKDTPAFAWLPDNKHLVLALSLHPTEPAHLWMADIRSNRLVPLTNGLAQESSPRPSPDGKSLLFTNFTSNFDIVSVSLADGSIKTLVTTGHHEDMPSWSAKKEMMVWATDRSGASEIWLRSPDGTDKPIITAEQFPGERLMNPSLSPMGDRLIFAKSDLAGSIRLWITSVSGGSPIRLTNTESVSEFGGSWSPDGNHFAFDESAGGKHLFRTVKTSGGAAPITIKGSTCGLAEWSPTGEWISCSAGSEWSVISPDGKVSQALGQIDSSNLAFSKDGKRLYGILNKDPKTGRASAILFFLDIEQHKQTMIKDLGIDFQPSSYISPGIRFSLAPDGKSFLYTTEKDREDIWMLQGFRQPSWLDRFSLH